MTKDVFIGNDFMGDQFSSHPERLSASFQNRSIIWYIAFSIYIYSDTLGHLDWEAKVPSS